jgi:glycosyltransferase involved in cell wall biosynthesis
MRHTPPFSSARLTRPVPHYCIEYTDESCAWEVAPRHPSDAQAAAYPHGLTATQDLAFEVVAPAPALDRLLVQFATYRRMNTGHLWCELQDKAGAVLARSYIPIDTVVDNAWRELLDLRGVLFEVGAKYLVRITAPLGTPDNSIAAYVIPAQLGRYELHRRIARFRNERTFVYDASEEQLNDSIGSRPRAFLIVAPGRDGMLRTGAAAALLGRQYPGAVFQTVTLEDSSRQWSALATADVVAFADIFEAEAGPGIGFDALCFELHRRGVCTLFVDTGELAYPGGHHGVAYLGSLGAHWERRRVQHRRCHFAHVAGDPPRLIEAMSDRPADELLAGADAGSEAPLHPLVARVRRGRLPHVAIVSVLYRKAAVIESFLDHVVRQTYPGLITAVLVDDCSPEGETTQAQVYGAALASQGVANRKVVTLANEGNLGNCASRLAGLAVKADIYVVIDCDCLINQEFIAAHVFEHWWDDVDVVIGPLNIESGGRDAPSLVRELEADPSRIVQEAEPQDPIQPDGFLNCITRNFSIKRGSVLQQPLFDLDFTYSAKPGSGFGWEDVEMGYRLYARGSVIRFTGAAFAVHCSHESSASERTKVQGSMRNFERVFAKHPEMDLVARRWAVDTYDKLRSWAEGVGADPGEVERRLGLRFARPLDEHRALLPMYRRGHRPLRILSYRWHVPHQYELYKLPHEFTLATGIGNGMVDRWAFEQRPLRPNVRFAPRDGIDPRDFDVAILHFDENALGSHLCNGVIPAEWGDPFRWLLEVPDLPKIGICHGTPQFAGQYGLDPNRKHGFVVHDEERQVLIDALAGARVKVVCNSWQALEDWGFADARVIWHGFDPQEFPAGTYQRDVLALDADRYRPHYRGAWERMEVERRLDPRIRLEAAEHPGAALEVRDTNAFAVRNFRSYVDRIRQFTAYLNTTLRSPMPRSRGEAMMTGVIPVCLRNHDVDRFIHAGVNGFYADEPGELAEFLNYLFRNRENARRIGAEARRTALDVFNHDRYLASWTTLLKEVVQ